MFRALLLTSADGPDRGAPWGGRGDDPDLGVPWDGPDHGDRGDDPVRDGGHNAAGS